MTSIAKELIGVNLEGQPRYIVEEDFKTLCCDTIMREGDVLEILKQTSKNRLIIGNVMNGGLHKVKRSTFHRCCKLIVS